MKRIRHILIPLSLAILFVLFPIPLNAVMTDSGNEIMPYWEYMNGISIGLNFRGTEGIADVTVSEIYGITTYLDATLNVYRRTGGDWTLIASTTQSGTSTLCLDVYFTAVYGQTYKAEVTVTAYGENGNETDTVSYQANCPKAEDS